MLDVMDKFVNNFGIVAVAFASLVAIVAKGKLSTLGHHINKTSSIKVGTFWRLSVVVTTGVLAFMLFSEAIKVSNEGYENYPSWFVNSFGWGMAVALVIVAFILSRLKWHNETEFNPENE